MEYYCLVLLFHIFFVGPLLIYLGLRYYNAHNYLWKSLIVLGVGIIAYHLPLYWKFKNPLNAFHVLFVGPAPFTSGSGTLEAIVSFQLETLIDENLNVTFTV